MTVLQGGLPPAHALAAADNAAGALTVKVLRAEAAGGENGIVNAIDLKGLPLGDAPFSFKPGERETEASIKLPVCSAPTIISRGRSIRSPTCGSPRASDQRKRSSASSISTCR